MIDIPRNVVVWILLWVSIDVLFSDGGVVSAAILGAAGGWLLESSPINSSIETVRSVAL